MFILKILAVVLLALSLGGCTPTQAPEKSSETTLSGTQTVPKQEEILYTLEEVTTHNTPSNCWTIIDTTVADVTSFFGKHPGGDEKLAKACGVDATEIFASVKKHDPNGYAKIMELKIGTLEK